MTYDSRERSDVAKPVMVRMIGLRNHGITVTRPCLMAILDRIELKILHQIPML
jgi:hypothetical protein